MRNKLIIVQGGNEIVCPWWLSQNKNGNTFAENIHMDIPYSQISKKNADFKKCAFNINGSSCTYNSCKTFLIGLNRVNVLIDFYCLNFHFLDTL
jgi:hypothetical protein